MEEGQLQDEPQPLCSGRFDAKTRGYFAKQAWTRRPGGFTRLQETLMETLAWLPRDLLTLSKSMGDPVPLGTPITVAGRPAALSTSLPGERHVMCLSPRHRGPGRLRSKAPLPSSTPAVSHHEPAPAPPTLFLLSPQPSPTQSLCRTTQQDPIK